MTSSTVTLTPGAMSAPGAGAIAEPTTTARRLTSADKLFSTTSALDRGGRDDYGPWLNHVSAAAACSQPVRLSGDLHTVDTRTGAVVETRSTLDMPDAVIYKACGNRRAAVCPACAEVYRADAYQLVLAGLKGGKGTPDTVGGHPAAFVTLTAPSFGTVHTRRTSKTGQVLPCRPRRKPDLCPHGRDLRCRNIHADDDSRLGHPLCADCYDYPSHAVWNGHASELWRRTTIAASRALQRHASAHGDKGRVRLSFGKVAEFQRRGVVHFHALVRLDGLDPLDREAVIPPPEWATVFVLSHLLREAVEGTSFITEPHPLRPAGWDIAWGAQLDIRPLRVKGDAAITDTAVAGYCAKYATKATEETGHSARRITPDTIDIYADGSHPGRIVNACWDLGRMTGYPGLRRWAHMLGFGGHFFTKSRRYSTTFRVLRQARTDWRRNRPRTADHLDGPTDNADTTVVINSLTYAGIGWHTTGDALLANTAAALAKERRRAAKEALQDIA